MSPDIDPQSFSQKMPGPFPAFPEKQPQNIHPFFFLSLSRIHVRSRASSSFLVTYVFRWLPGVTQVSSDQRIASHCSSVQFRCSRANSRRSCRFFSEIGGFRSATYLLYPACHKAKRDCILSNSSKFKLNCKALIRHTSIRF